jgi:hypothetical protein
MGVGSFWDTTYHHLILGQQVPLDILVESLVTIGHQAHYIHYFPPPNQWPDKVHQLDDCAHPAHVQL